MGKNGPSAERKMTCKQTAAWFGVYASTDLLLQAASHLREATSAMPVQPNLTDPGPDA